MDDKLRTPFTAEQVEQLNKFQDSGLYHPFTCGNSSRHRNLVATADGWICLDCDYKQHWAHGFMADAKTLAFDWRVALGKEPSDG